MTNPLVNDSNTCAEIQSLSINSAPEVSGLTSFVQEACTAVETRGTHLVNASLAIPNPGLQDLKAYFQRPRMIQAGTFLTGVRNLLYSEDVTPNAIFTSYFTDGIKRMLGVFGVTYKLVYTLQVAATPFHQGLISLNWQYGNYGGLSLRRITSQTATNIPHVLMDLSVDTMVQLSVPFMYPHEFVTPNESDNYGFLGINAVAPIAAVTGITPPTYKLYVHLEDLQFFGAVPSSTTNVTLQSGKKIGPFEKEYEQEAYPLSSSVSSFGRSIKWLAKGVPAISSLTSTPLWLLGHAAGLARYFGYSKPVIQDPVCKMRDVKTLSEHNVDAASSVLIAGPIASNHLKVDPTFSGTDVDEMSLAYITSQYSQICYGEMTTSNTTGVVLHAGYVSPSAHWFRRGSSVPYCNVTAPLAALDDFTSCFTPANTFYVATCFRSWRGGFKYRFTFAKTKYHAGRVMVMYVPTPLVTSQAPSDTYGIALAPETSGGLVQPFGYSAIFDLKDNNVFEFEVPYVSSLPYNDVYANTGSITLTVVDPLLAPNVVSSTVPFIVEVKGMPDFECAVPIGPNYRPVKCTNSGHVRLQSGEVLRAMPEEVCASTIGEKIASVKQLIMIPKTTKPTTNVDTNNHYAITVLPWWYGWPRTDAVPASPTNLPESFGFGHYFASAYNYVNGSTDVFCYSTRPEVNFWASINPYYGATVNSVVLGSAVNRPTCNTARARSGGGVVGFRFPAYQKLQRWYSDCLTAYNYVAAFGSPYATPALAGGDYQPSNFGSITIDNRSGATVQAFVSRAAGDDARLGHYIGPPFLYLNRNPSPIYIYDEDSNGIF